ncbi:MAG: hypothetical protein HETSPECPRED_008707 [Heterodermia speciosa]|uniref:Uncharacterized protein n=1 Tax=Heterodermia speciosa TaxID=116794 RepID=A0A8H3IV30_9LECA|nr:MAG: hypothetical protein HETSPECPRED_008707 [Heterodermia speciosa]
MTPADFHFISRITDVAGNKALRNATSNVTVAAIMSADVSELKTPFFWIQLGLIPIPPIIACYLFTKVADYIGYYITNYRQPRVGPRPGARSVSQTTSEANSLTADRIKEDTRRDQGIWKETDEKHDSTSEATRMEPSGRQSPVPSTTGFYRTPMSTLVSTGPVKDNSVTGNNNIHEATEGTSLTRDRHGDAKQGIGRDGSGVHRVGGRVASDSQEPGKSGWWFDGRWD